MGFGETIGKLNDIGEQIRATEKNSQESAPNNEKSRSYEWGRKAGLVVGNVFKAITDAPGRLVRFGANLFEKGGNIAKAVTSESGQAVLKETIDGAVGKVKDATSSIVGRLVEGVGNAQRGVEDGFAEFRATNIDRPYINKLMTELGEAQLIKKTALDNWVAANLAFDALPSDLIKTSTGKQINDILQQSHVAHSEAFGRCYDLEKNIGNVRERIRLALERRNAPQTGELTGKSIQIELPHDKQQPRQTA